MKATTKEKILATAEQLFAERGFDGISIRDIVNGADVNLGAVTYYFGSKDRLFAAVIERKIAPMFKMARTIIESPKRPSEKLRMMMQAYAEHILYTNPQMKVFFSEMVSGGRRLPKVAKDAVDFRNRMFIRIVREGIKSGEFRKCDLECAAWSFFGMMTAYILYEPLAGSAGRLKPYPKPYVNRIVTACMDVFLNGISGKRK